MFYLKWSHGNAKVSKLDAVAFGLPAYRGADGFKTCPQAGACAAVCYARQGSYTWPAVIAAREFNLALARSAEFPAMLVADLEHLKAPIIRIHDSGDFFNQDYLDAWIFAARKFPGKTFYAYTKSLHLDFSFAPPNLRVVQSEGGLMDAQINRRRSHSRIFATTADRKRAGYVDGNKTDQPAIDGEHKIGLVYHGTRNMTDAQKKYFS